MLIPLLPSHFLTQIHVLFQQSKVVFSMITDTVTKALKAIRDNPVLQKILKIMSTSSPLKTVEEATVGLFHQVCSLSIDNMER